MTTHDAPEPARDSAPARRRLAIQRDDEPIAADESDFLEPMPYTWTQTGYWARQAVKAFGRDSDDDMEATPTPTPPASQQGPGEPSAVPDAGAEVTGDAG